METPYLDQEIKYLEDGLEKNTISFYQHKKLIEFRNIKTKLLTPKTK